MEYFVCLIKDGITPFARDEAMIRAYMSDLYKNDDPIIYKVDDEKLKQIADIYCIDEVFPQWEDFYFTDSDAEMISQSLEEDAMEISHCVKLLQEELKYYDTPASIKLKKALKEFKKERIESNDVDIDQYDFVERLIEKVNLKKYTKSRFKEYRKNYYSEKKRKKE